MDKYTEEGMRGKNVNLSFIIASYNKKEYLENAIHSCLEQDIEEFEIIIGDDGSNDGSIDLIKKFKERYPNIIEYFVQDRSEIEGDIIPSIRVSNVIFKGLDMASGKYCMVLAGDDYFYKSDFFSEAISFLDKHAEYSAYVGGYDMVWENKEPRHCFWRITPRLYWSGAYIHISSFVFRKKIYTEGTLLSRFCDDTGLSYALASEGKWCFDETPVFAYRQREDSITYSLGNFELAVVELLLFQDTLNKGKVILQSLARFAVPLSVVYKNRKLFEEKKYRKYVVEGATQDNNIIGLICDYDKKTWTKKTMFFLGLLFCDICRICFMFLIYFCRVSDKLRNCKIRKA